MSNERELQRGATPSWMEAAATRLEDATEPQQAQACTTGKDDACERAKTVITASFASMQHYAMIELGRLKSDLMKADKPNWVDGLLEKVLDISLSVGGERVGEYLAERLVSHGAKMLSGLMKKSCEEGAPAGVSLARESLGPGAKPDAEAFIEAQQMGVLAMYQDAQRSFIESGQDALANTAEARHLAAALDAKHLVDAARHHYRASRDEYVATLAKQTLGTTDDGTADMSPGEHEHGRATHSGLIAMGVDRGVLEADVMLYDDVKAEPTAYRALLNGVNDAIRKQYEHVPLASVKIPRVLVCSVRGDMSDFTVNVDESGGMHLVHGSGEWLEARARAENADAKNVSRHEQQRIGLDLLLRDLEIDELGHGGKE